jgi:hypothetical protein
MKKQKTKKDLESALIKGTERTLSGAANFFMIPLCCGALYEIKAPKKLVK